MKKLLCVMLTLCLLLTLFPAMAATARSMDVVEIWNAEDFYAAFEKNGDQVTIPAGVAAEIRAESLYINDPIVVEDDAALRVQDRAYLYTVQIRNQGIVEVQTGGTMICGAEFENNAFLRVCYNGVFGVDGGCDFVNNGSFQLRGIYLCNVIDGGLLSQRLAYCDQGDEDTSSGSAVILASMDETPTLDYGAATADAKSLFADADIYCLADSFSDLQALNANENVEGIYTECRGDDFILPIMEDLTIDKKLCVGPCDLLLQSGVTLTIYNPDDHLLMRENGRIVVEAEGAAGPECPAGGTLVLDGVAVLSGEADKGAINPTRDIVWLASRGDDGSRSYPGPANEIQIGSWVEAEAHGDLSALENLDIVMQTGESRLTLTDHFRCTRIGINGDLELNGFDLTADEVFFANESRVNENGGTLNGNYRYQARVIAEPYGSREHAGLPAGEKLYLEDLGIPCEEITADESFKGWIIETRWDVPSDALEVLSVMTETDSGSDHYTHHYLLMPAFPVEIRADWKTERVELKKYDVTVAFDGVEGHDYTLAYVDSIHTTDEDLEALGTSREVMNTVVEQLSAELSEGDALLRLFNFVVNEGDAEAHIDPYEIIIPLDNQMKGYQYLGVVPVRIRDDGAFIDGNSFNTRIEDDQLIAQMPNNADAYLIVGSNTDPHAVGSIHLNFERPASGTITDTPYDADHEVWLWTEQQNRPRVSINGLRGAYLSEAYWTLADDADVPFIGTMENGRLYGLSVTMLAEPDCWFADEVDITIDGATYVGYVTHVRDEDEKADILYISFFFKPIPTNVKIGDVDGDNDITILDATYIQRNLAGLWNECFVDEAGDVDGDNEITILDATYIQRWLAGINDPFPVGKLLED